MARQRVDPIAEGPPVLAYEVWRCPAEDCAFWQRCSLSGQDPPKGAFRAMMGRVFGRKPPKYSEPELEVTGPASAPRTLLIRCATKESGAWRVRRD